MGKGWAPQGSNRKDSDGFQVGIRQVRADKTGTASYEDTQSRAPFLLRKDWLGKP